MVLLVSKKKSGASDEVEGIIGNLRRVRAAIRVCLRGVREAKSRAWEWRDRREQIKAETASVRIQMEEVRTRRNQLNAEVARLKRLRNEEVERARSLQDKIREVNRELGRMGELMSVEELEQRFRELEWRHQTTPTTLEEERHLLDEMARVARAMRRAARKEQLLGSSHGNIDGLWEQLEEARRRAQEFHEQIVAVAEQAQREHQKLVELAETIRPNLEEEKEAHQQFLQCLAEAQG